MSLVMSDNNQYKLYITDTTTGECRLIAQEDSWDDDAIELYLYTEGNYSCDCNRNLLFTRAFKEPDDLYRSCTGNRFLLTVYAPNGSKVYEEE